MDTALVNMSVQTNLQWWLERLMTNSVASLNFQRSSSIMSKYNSSPVRDKKQAVMFVNFLQSELWQLSRPVNSNLLATGWVSCIGFFNNFSIFFYNLFSVAHWFGASQQVLWRKKFKKTQQTFHLSPFLFRCAGHSISLWLLESPGSTS